jgi:DNA repair exonuclease SbcCD ATPase subunit
MIKSKQINKLLATIRDPKNSLEIRGIAVEILKKEINKYALGEEGRLEANFATFDELWKPFEEMIFAFEHVDSDIDDDEVNKLIQQESEIAELERRLQALNDFTIEDLERRWRTLHEFNVTLNKPPSILPPPKEKDELEKIQISEEDFKSFDFSSLVSNINQMIEQTEQSITELEEEEERRSFKIKEKSQLEQPKQLNTSAADQYSTQDLSKNKIFVPTPFVQTRATEQEKAILVRPKIDKTTIFNAIAKQIKSFIQTIENFIKKIGKNNISFPKAIEILEKTQEELQRSETRVGNAGLYLKNTRSEILEQHIAIRNKQTQLNNEGKEIQKQKVLLQKARPGNYSAKSTVIEKLNSKITQLEQEYKESRCSLTTMIDQFNKTTVKTNSACDDWKNAKVMHKIATKSVDKAIKSAEQAIEQEKNIDQQQRIKEVISRGRAGPENAKNLIESAEEILEISLHRL